MSETAFTRHIRAVDVLSVLVIAPAVAWIWMWCADPDRSLTLLLLGVSVGGAATFGVMTWLWAADHGWTRLTARVGLGAVAGLGPPVTVVLAATLGLLWRNGVADTLELLGQGAPIPAYGLLTWPHFVSLSAQCAGVGAISGAIQWTIGCISMTKPNGDRSQS